MKKTEDEFKFILNEIGKRLDDKRDISWFNLHYNRFLETLDTLITKVPRCSMILDVGCFGHAQENGLN